MTILEKILTEKRKEVEALRQQTFQPYTTNKRIKPFSEIVRTKTTMAIIAEIKRASPSKGMINAHVDPVKQALQYEENGASAISVLTDTPFFKGSMEDLRKVRQVVDVPILCKDFIIDPIQIDRAQAAGANIILLIAAALDDDTLTRLYTYARARELEVLCEVHHANEMERVLAIGATLIGINNRNLNTFEVDIQTTNTLATMVTNPETILISESGIQTKTDVTQIAEAGAQAILVGETLMREKDLTGKMKELQIALPNKVRK